MAIRNVPALRRLASRGANLTAKNAQGRTPLDAALAARPPLGEAAETLRQLTGATSPSGTEGRSAAAR
jgi:hypothetical protein